MDMRLLHRAVPYTLEFLGGLTFFYFLQYDIYWLSFPMGLLFGFRLVLLQCEDYI